MELTDDLLTFTAVSILALSFGAIVSALLGIYSHFYGPLKWSEDSDVFALIEQWVFHPIGRQIHKVYPIYEEETSINVIPFLDLVDEIKANASPEELEELSAAYARAEADFHWDNPFEWDFPTFRLVSRPYDHEWDEL